MTKVVKRIARNYKKFTIAEKVELFGTIIGILLMGWLFFSWAEIAANNLTYGYEYSPANLLVIIFDFFETATVK